MHKIPSHARGGAHSGRGSRDTISSLPQEPWMQSDTADNGDDNDDALGEVDLDVEVGASLMETKNEGSEAGKGTAPKRKRPLKLTASQRERKRAIDREAQRSIRIKTKNYIAHLESLVKAMEQNDSHGPEGDSNRTKELMNQLRQSQEEVRRLREAMLGVQRVLGGALGDLSKLGATAEGHEARQMSSSASPPSGNEQASVLGGSFSGPSRPTIDTGGGAFWLPPDSNQPASSTGVASAVTSPPSIHPNRPAKDPSQRFEGEMFYYAEYHLSRVYSAPGPGAFSNRPFDEDIIVRAVVEGWPAVEERYPLDLGWQVLQEIDQVIFGDCGVVERMAALRLLRMKLLHVANSKAGGTMSGPQGIPQYMTSEVVQHDNRANVVDNFVWPGFRKLLIETPQRYITNEFNEGFRHNLKFLWPYDVSETYTKDPISSLYCSSPEFMRRQADIRCWTMKRQFFNGYEELWETIPAYEADIQKALPAPPMSQPAQRSTHGNMIQMQSQSMRLMGEHDQEEAVSEANVPRGPAGVLPSNDTAAWVAHPTHVPPMQGYWSDAMDQGMAQGYAAQGHPHGQPLQHRGSQGHHTYQP
jgi:hypothetical protein